MRNTDEVRAVWLFVFFVGEVIVTALSFAFGQAWFVFWILAQVGLFIASAQITSLLFTIKERNKE